MTTSEPRIVAVTDSTALAIGLTCTPTPWDVVCRPSAEAVPDELADAAVLVLDLGSASAGLDVFSEVRAACVVNGGRRRAAVVEAPRAVVIADDEPSGALPAGATVLLRPFTLPQLQDAIAALLVPPGSVASDGDDREEEASDPAEPKPEAAAGELASPLASRLFGRLTADAEPEEATPPAPDAVEDMDLPGAVAVDDAATVAEPVIEAAPTARTRVEGEGLHGIVFLTPDLAGPRNPGSQGGFARRQRKVSSSDGRLRERLAAVLAATSELERLIEQVPLLNSLDDLARAIVADLASQFDADTVGLWRATPDGWEVQAHHGLTAHEATWRVPFDHPLFSELEHTGGAILIDPVDVVQATVAGIGGAHTESLMAASIAAGPGRFGILVVGRNRPLVTSDLDRLIDLASEAAPGMAVAEQLARLRGPEVRIDLPEHEPARSWRRQP